MDAVRVAFIGAGGVAKRHARTLLGFEDARVVGVADPAADRAHELASSTGARAYPDYHEMLADERIDALYICVPPFAHGEPELTAISAGLPFLVEKPVAIDLITAESIAEAVQARGLITCVGYHWRYLDTLDRAQELLADGRQAQLVLGYWLDKVPDRPWWTHRGLSGGQVIEQTTHILDLARTLVGEVEEVYAVGVASQRGRDKPAADIDAATVATLRFCAGAVGMVASTSLCHALHRSSLELFADGLRMEFSETALVIDSGRGAELHEAQGNARSRPDRDFIDAVRGRPNLIRVPYAEALQTHRLGWAITRSAAEGKPVAPTDG
jgi:predicted dehydrogenase